MGSVAETEQFTSNSIFECGFSRQLLTVVPIPQRINLVLKVAT